MANVAETSRGTAQSVTAFLNLADSSSSCSSMARFRESLHSLSCNRKYYTYKLSRSAWYTLRRF